MSIFSTLLSVLGAAQSATPLIHTLVTTAGTVAAEALPDHADTINKTVSAVTQDDEKLQAAASAISSVATTMASATSHGELLSIAATVLAFIPVTAPYAPILKAIAASEPAAEAFVTAVVGALKTATPSAAPVAATPEPVLEVPATSSKSVEGADPNVNDGEV